MILIMIGDTLFSESAIISSYIAVATSFKRNHSLDSWPRYEYVSANIHGTSWIPDDQLELW